MWLLLIEKIVRNTRHWEVWEQLAGFIRRQKASTGNLMFVLLLYSTCRCYYKFMHGIGLILNIFSNCTAATKQFTKITLSWKLLCKMFENWLLYDNFWSTVWFNWLLFRNVHERVMHCLKEIVAYTGVTLQPFAVLYHHHLQAESSKDHQGFRIGHLFQHGWSH